MPRRLKIYGERNTNTNYLSRLIKLNLEVQQVRGAVPMNVARLQQVLPGRERVRDLYFAFTFASNLGWKHSRVRSAEELRACAMVDADQSFLTITKNPYSWALSLFRRPYHQYYTDKPDLETFLRRPWKPVGRDNVDGVLRNPIELWNVKNRSYLGIASLDTLSITTESIFEGPEALIDRIAARFSLGRRSPAFINHDESTKDSSKDFAYYQDYYLNEKWRAEIPDEAIAIINESVDRDLMAHFGYRILS